MDEGTWNRWLEGLPTLIGVAKTDGSRSDFVYNEDAAFIFTGPFELTAYRNGQMDEYETEQLACRMRYVRFSRPAPQQGLDRSFKACAMCWSQWLLQGALAKHMSTGAPLDAFMTKVFETLGQGVSAQSQPAQIHSVGSSSSAPQRDSDCLINCPVRCNGAAKACLQKASSMRRSSG